jgi:hypothetical protein
MQHTHFGAVSIFGAFVGYLMCNTLWKLSAAHLIASTRSDKLTLLGQAMSVQS